MRNMADVRSTEQMFRDVIAKYVEDNNYDPDFQVTPISTEGANYTSHLFITTLTKDGESLDLFSKVAAIGEKMRAQNPMRIYDNEILFYTYIAKRFNEIEDKQNLPEEHRLRKTKFYACDATTLEEVLVLEDLTKRGFTTHNRLNVVDWQYAAGAFSQLAKYHALTVAYRLYYPQEFEKTAATLDVNFKQGNMHESYFQMSMDKALAVTKEENRDRLRKFLTKYLMDVDSFLENFKPSKLKVITHGDYRPSNLMHRTLEDDSVEVIPIDFQTLQVGSPVTDLLYFITAATDKAFRRQHFDDLLDLYYTQLSGAMTRLGLDPQKIYSKTDFELELKDKIKFGLCVSTMILPIVTVDTENAPKVHKDMDITDFTIQASDQFAVRFNDLVDDYIQWGDL